MNDLDDARLRAHLERRGGTGDPPDTLPAAIHERASSIAQHRLVPAPALRLRRGWLALAAVLAGTALVFASAGFKLPLPAPDGPASALTVLSSSQLVQLISESPPESWLDRVVIVDADVQPIEGVVSCVGPCPIGYVSGTRRGVVLHRDSDATFRSSGFPRSESLDGGTIRGPIAIRLLEDGAAELIGPVHPTASSGLTWSLESFVPETTRLAESQAPAGSDGVVLGPLFVVDAWLARSPFAPPCPGPFEGTPTSVIPYMCGTASWLTPRPIAGDELSTPGSAPPDGLRVQNGAYDSFAPNLARPGPLGLPESRRALYLVRSILQFPAGWCALCDGRPGYLVARMDPIAPPDADPSPSAAPPSVTVWGAADFARLVAETPVAGWGDQVAIVDGQIKVSTSSCPLFTAPSCPIGTLVGTEPGLLVWSDSTPAYVDDTSAEWAWLRDTIEGLLALRLAASGQVELVGPVEMLGNTTVWPVWAVVDEIARLRSFDRRIGPDGISVGPLFVVDAWLVTPMAPECPAPAESAAPFVAAFECGNVAFLTRDAIQPSMLAGESIVTAVLEGSIRVQNLAYETFAPDPTWSTVNGLAEPRRALYLVRSIVDFPQDSCFMCDAAGQAFIDARIDPIEVPPAAED